MFIRVGWFLLSILPLPTRRRVNRLLLPTEVDPLPFPAGRVPLPTRRKVDPLPLPSRRMVDPLPLPTGRANPLPLPTKRKVDSLPLPTKRGMSPFPLPAQRREVNWVNSNTAKMRPPTPSLWILNSRVLQPMNYHLISHSGEYSSKLAISAI